MKRCILSTLLCITAGLVFATTASSAPLSSADAGIIDAADALLANGRPIRFDCGKSASFTFSAEGTTVVSRTVDLGRLPGDECEDWKKNRESICKDKIGEITEADKKKAQEEAQKKCNESVRAKLAGLNIQCNESSRNSCANPDECSPFRDNPTQPYSCPLPELNGTSEIKTRYFELGFDEEMTCSLKCHLEFGAKAVKDIKIPAGCALCER